MASTEATRKAPFIGREAELADMRAAHDDALRLGRSSFVLVHGEPGIGKSRLVAESAARAIDEGARLLQGQCEELAASAALQPFKDILAALAGNPAGQTLLEHAGRAYPELAPLLPDPRHFDPATPINPMNERHRLYESLSRVLADVASMSPKGLLLVLEDIHWADQSSLELIHYLARRPRDAAILIVCTYRDADVDAGSPLALTLEAIRRIESTRRIGLKRWDRDEVRQYLAAVVRPFAPPPVVNALVERTEGNPFFVKELVEELLQNGRLLDEAGAWRLDLRFSEGELPGDTLLLIGQVLRRASGACREALQDAAVLGSVFDFQLLSRVSALDQERLVSALDEATRLTLVEPASSGMRFSHELIRQALLHEASLPRRQQLHLQAFRALRADDAAEVSAVRLANHLIAAGSLANPGETIEYATQAGRESMRLFAYADAARFYAVAIDLQSRVAHDAESTLALARLRARHGEALFFLARHRDARPDFEMAAEALPEEKRADVLVPLALACIWTEDMGSARAAVTEAETLIARFHRDDLTPAVEALKAYCETNDGHLLVANSRFRESAELAAFTRRGAHSKLLSQFPLNLYWTGDFTEAVERGESAIRAARELHDRSELASLLPSVGLSLAAAGRYREAASMFEEARQVAGELETEIQAIAAVSKSVGFHIDTFDYEGAKERASFVYRPARALSHYPYMAISSGLDLLLIAARRGELEDADEILASIEERITIEHSRHGWLWRMRLAVARAEVELARGNATAALDFAEDGLQRAIEIHRPKYQALALEASGNALMRLGRPDEALASFREAVEVARPTGDPAMFLRAATQLLAVTADAELIAEAWEAADRIRANLPEEMLEPFEASAPVRMLSSQQAGNGHQHDDLLPAGLSRREFEVLLLLVDGKSNQQIADELVLSVRTVERHINHIYGKLGVHTRSQATSFVHREGLLTR